ncbi:hypothetical protein F4778DRAFT_738052 [Xylariomycetidae sp. FL2044]|nr:hypothetical protein F4778DRAFT_738052 [Xylariomycetidae sp. FL2044]
MSETEVATQTEDTKPEQEHPHAPRSATPRSASTGQVLTPDQKLTPADFREDEVHAYETNAAGDIVRRTKYNEHGQALANKIREMYESGAKLYAKDMFRDMEAHLARDPKPKTIMLRSMNDVIGEEEIHFPDDPYYNSLISDPVFQKIQDLVSEAETRGYAPRGDKTISRYSRALTLGRVSPTRESSMTYEQLRAEWDRASADWQRSEARARLESIFRDHACVAPTTSKVIGFGLGPLEEWVPEDRKLDWTPKRRSITQHLAAQTIASVLCERLGRAGPLPVVLQEPAYTELAKRLLRDRGFEVVGGHGLLGFAAVDEDTVVCSCACNVPVRQIVADIARPAAMLWDRIHPAEEETSEWVMDWRCGSLCPVSPWTTDNDSARTRALVASGYEKHGFDVDHDRFCPKMEVYIRTE